MRFVILFLFGALMANCAGDETVRGHGGADKIWHLTELNGVAFGGTATLRFPEPGRIAGQAPCNSYTGAMTVPYPWFEAGPLAVTRMACPDLGIEREYLNTLERATLVEVLGGTLILSDEDGVLMVFKASV